MVWIVSSALVLAAVRLLVRRRRRPDEGLWKEHRRFGTRPIRPEWRHYDQTLATRKALEARRFTASGRPIPDPRVPKAIEFTRRSTAIGRLR